MEESVYTKTCAIIVSFDVIDFEKGKIFIVQGLNCHLLLQNSFYISADRQLKMTTFENFNMGKNQ